MSHSLGDKALFEKLKARILLKFNTGNIKSYRDYLRALNYGDSLIDYAYFNSSEQLKEPLDRKRLNELLSGEEWRRLHNQYDYTQNDNSNNRQTSTTRNIHPREDSRDTSGRDEVSILQTNILSSQPISSYKPDSEHPKQKAKLIHKQEDAAKQLFEGIVQHNKHGQLLIARGGKGKTFILGAVIRRLLDQPNWLASKSLAPWKIVYITKAPIIEQTSRVLIRQFGIDTDHECITVNIEALRASFGDMFITWNTIVEGGDADIKPVWKPMVYPCIFILDECQSVKNEGSLQSKVIQAATELNNKYPKFPVYFLFSSATPFSKPTQAKTFALSCRIPLNDGTGTILDKHSWPSWIANVASPSDPNIYCEAAVERLMKVLDPYVTEVKGMKSQFNAINSIEMIEFLSAEERKRYDDAWQKHLERKAKIYADSSLSEGQSEFSEWASFTIFRIEAEDIRAEYISDFLHKNWQAGFAPVAALCFKKGITSVVRFLINKHGYNRNDISLIWGGVARKQKVKKMKSQTMSATELANFSHIATMSGMSAEEVRELLDSVEETVEEEINQDIDPSLRLGNQSKQERQREIDKFQAGKTKFCIFTFKSGGVGLSLHHCDELTTYKVKRKPSGYYVESDIPNCTEVRPRKVILTPPYSDVELIQGLFRCPRITSMSDTEQIIAAYKDTIEESVVAKVFTKIKCHNKVVRHDKTGEGVIFDLDKVTGNLEHQLPKALNKKFKSKKSNNNNVDSDDEDDDIFSLGDEDE